MVSFVHLTDETHFSLIRKLGIRPTRFEKGATLKQGVFAMALNADFHASHQWLRELKRSPRARIGGIYFRLPAYETVYFGRYNATHIKMTAVEAAQATKADMLGYEVIVPRRIKPAEIYKIKTLPQIVGWRYFPEAKGHEPLWPCSGTYGANRLRRNIEHKYEGR